MIDPEKMDSEEERQFYSWLLEAEEADLVSRIQYQPESFSLSGKASIQVEKKLKTKTKIVEIFLLGPHEYTPDFVFMWSGEKNHPFVSFATNWAWVDVKGTFNRFGDQKQFSINQKWVYDKYRIYINKVVPEKLFKETWVPEACRFTPKQNKPVKKYIGCRTVNQYLTHIKE